eukprot:3263633-Prymnesium_polylepis.1
MRASSRTPPRRRPAMHSGEENRLNYAHLEWIGATDQNGSICTFFHLHGANHHLGRLLDHLLDTHGLGRLSELGFGHGDECLAEQVHVLLLALAPALLLVDRDVFASICEASAQRRLSGDICESSLTATRRET